MIFAVMAKQRSVKITRLIDADWVLAHVKPYSTADEEWTCTGGTAIRLIRNVVDNAPSIDAVPVVRCADCIYLVNATYDQYCSNSYGLRTVLHDTYCPYGKRVNQ